MHRIAPLPDVAILIDVEPHAAVQRISGSRGDIPNEFERVDYLETVRGHFLGIAPQFGMDVVNGHMAPDMVFNTIAHILIEGALKRKRCAKPYGCDIFDCPYRINSECDWFAVQAKLRDEQTDRVG